MLVPLPCGRVCRIATSRSANSHQLRLVASFHTFSTEQQKFVSASVALGSSANSAAIDTRVLISKSIADQQSVIAADAIQWNSNSGDEAVHVLFASVDLPAALAAPTNAQEFDQKAVAANPKVDRKRKSVHLHQQDQNQQQPLGISETASGTNVHQAKKSSANRTQTLHLVRVDANALLSHTVWSFPLPANETVREGRIIQGQRCIVLTDKRCRIIAPNNSQSTLAASASACASASASASVSSSDPIVKESPMQASQHSEILSLTLLHSSAQSDSQAKSDLGSNPLLHILIRLVDATTSRIFCATLLHPQSEMECDQVSKLNISQQRLLLFGVTQKQMQRATACHIQLDPIEHQPNDQSHNQPQSRQHSDHSIMPRVFVATTSRQLLCFAASDLQQVIEVDHCVSRIQLLPGVDGGHPLLALLLTDENQTLQLYRFDDELRLLTCVPRVQSICAGQFVASAQIAPIDQANSLTDVAMPSASSVRDHTSHATPQQQANQQQLLLVFSDYSSHKKWSGDRCCITDLKNEFTPHRQTKGAEYNVDLYASTTIRDKVRGALQMQQLAAQDAIKQCEIKLRAKREWIARQIQSLQQSQFKSSNLNRAEVVMNDAVLSQRPNSINSQPPIRLYSLDDPLDEERENKHCELAQIAPQSRSPCLDSKSGLRALGFSGFDLQAVYFASQNCDTSSTVGIWRFQAELNCNSIASEAEVELPTNEAVSASRQSHSRRFALSIASRSSCIVLRCHSPTQCLNGEFHSGSDRLVLSASIEASACWPVDLDCVSFDVQLVECIEFESSATSDPMMPCASSNSFPFPFPRCASLTLIHLPRWPTHNQRVEVPFSQTEAPHQVRKQPLAYPFDQVHPPQHSQTFHRNSMRFEAQQGFTQEVEIVHSFGEEMSTLPDAWDSASTQRLVEYAIRRDCRFSKRTRQTETETTNANNRSNHNNITGRTQHTDRGMEFESDHDSIVAHCRCQLLIEPRLALLVQAASPTSIVTLLSVLQRTLPSTIQFKLAASKD